MSKGDPIENVFAGPRPDDPWTLEDVRGDVAYLDPDGTSPGLQAWLRAAERYDEYLREEGRVPEWPEPPGIPDAFSDPPDFDAYTAALAVQWERSRSRYAAQ